MGSANQCILGNVYRRSNVARKHCFVQTQIWGELWPVSIVLDLVGSEKTVEVTAIILQLAGSQT